jgi:hypothetical protein
LQATARQPSLAKHCAWMAGFLLLHCESVSCENVCVHTHARQSSVDSPAFVRKF